MCSSDLADKIVQLLGDEAQRLRMGQIGMERVARELSWEYEAPRLLQAYDRLFQGSRTATRQM